MNNIIKLRGLISLNFLIFFLPFLKMCSGVEKKSEVAAEAAISMQNNTEAQSDTLVLDTLEESQTLSKLVPILDNQGIVYNFYEAVYFNFETDMIEDFEFSPFICYPLVLFLVILMFIGSIFNKTMLIRTLSIINIVLLLGSVVWFYFLEIIENINQLRIGFYLIILNMVLIFILSNQKQKT